MIRIAISTMTDTYVPQPVRITGAEETVKSVIDEYVALTGDRVSRFWALNGEPLSEDELDMTFGDLLEPDDSWARLTNFVLAGSDNFGQGIAV